jgi:death on curing protein
VDYIWPTLAVVLAIHDEQIAEHGGPVGLRDAGLLSSALHRPLHHLSFADPDIAQLAAVLAHALITDHPFVDGNKRTSFVVTELFLDLNGHELIAGDAEVVSTWLSLADGTLDEETLASWIREHIKSKQKSK